jgi:hypothetical protein
MEQAYIDSLTDREKQAYEIAKSHMKSLFKLDRTAGFLQWKAKQTAVAAVAAVAAASGTSSTPSKTSK